MLKRLKTFHTTRAVLVLLLRLKVFVAAASLAIISGSVNPVYGNENYILLSLSGIFNPVNKNGKLNQKLGEKLKRNENI
jgi:hypothetical protein